MDKNYNYKHTKGFIVFIFVTILMALVAVYAQVPNSYTTNLINNTTTANNVSSTWQNAGTINQPITCWAPGDPGYCGPKPYVNAWEGPNTINFSYGMTEIYQMVNIGKALPNNGTGLVNTGYIFSFLAKNGNGWDDGRQDILKAQVTLYGPNNVKVLEQHSYDLNSVFNWTNFSYNVNWSTTKVGYRENQVGNVKFGFYGMDNNYWAGPYGPEVTNISFQLKYKPDPCVKNPLFSPECPKFQEELNKNLSSNYNTEPTYTKTEFEPSKLDDNHDPKKESNFAMGEKEEGVFVHEDERFTEPTHNRLDNLEFALTKIFDAQARQEEQSLDIANTAVSKTEQQTKEVVRNAEQRVREVVNQQFRDIENIKPQLLTEQTKQNNTSLESIFKGPENSSSVTQFQLQGNQNTSVVTILQDNKIQNNQQREQTQVSVVRQGQQIQQQNNNNKQDTEFKFELKNEQSKQYETVFGTVNNNQILPSVAIYAPLQNTIVSPPNIQQIITPNIEVTVQPVILAPRPESQINLQSTVPIIDIVKPNIEQFQPSKPIQNVDIPIIASNFLTNKADPLNEILEPKTFIKTENKNEEKTQTVKTNVVDNDVAGNVSIQTIAVSPVGFNQYTNFILRDVAFYAPKEIYRGQRTVDNNRALRNLASDRLHQDMVNQQYRR